MDFIGAYFSLPLPAPAAIRWGDGGGWHMMPGAGWGMGMGWLGMLLGIAFWVLLFIALFYLIRYLILATGRGAGPPPAPPPAPPRTAMDILKERYARGEIDREEFETKKRDLAD